MNLGEITLCDFCLALIDLPGDITTLHESRPHHATYGHLSTSSESCGLCKTIVSLWNFEAPAREIWNESHQYSPDDDSVCIILAGARRMPSGVTWIFINAEVGSSISPLCWIRTFTLVSCRLGDAASQFPLWRGLGQTIDDRLLLIKSWLYECRTHHAHGECRPVPFVPARLIQVGLDGSPPRLVSLQGSNGQAEYATLSHCWGDGKSSLNTTSQNLAQFSTEIPLELIPKTFADALRITRALEIPHLWIDALCIVQDDEDDWQSQAGQMDKVYQGSELTIAASFSSDSSKGCFPSDNHGTLDGDMVFSTRRSGSDGPVFLVRAYIDDLRSHSLSGRSIISTRGWTLQEQLLSNRLLSCMQPDMQWQCQSGLQTQSGLAFAPEETIKTSGSWHIAVLNRSLLLENDRRWKAWQMVVENYSKRRFTFLQDRIPAIAGLVKYFASLIDDVPLLGIWKGSIAMDLAWLRLSKPLELPASQKLPSWTWLACGSRIVYDCWGDNLYSTTASDGFISMEHVQLLGWDIQWVGPAYTSSLKSAYLQVEGPVREIPLESFPEGNASNPPYFQVFGENIKLISKNIPWRCAGQFDDARENVAGTYLCLLLYSTMWTIQPQRFKEICLILEPVDPQQEDTYKRVGLARLWGESRVFDPTKTRALRLV